MTMPHIIAHDSRLSSWMTITIMVWVGRYCHQILIFVDELGCRVYARPNPPETSLEMENMPFVEMQNNSNSDSFGVQNICCMHHWHLMTYSLLTLEFWFWLWYVLVPLKIWWNMLCRKSLHFVDHSIVQLCFVFDDYIVTNCYIKL